MTPHVAPALALRIHATRAFRRLGWAGATGAAAIVAAGAVLACAWSDHQTAAAAAARTLSVPATIYADPHGATAPASTAVASTLPRESDVPAMLTTLKNIAVDNGLGWPAADYRARPASEHEPASLEIRTQFNGTYPQIRRLLAQVLERVPAVTLRQLSLTRTSSGTPQLEVKVVFAILMQDDLAVPDPVASESPRIDGTERGKP